MRIDRGSSAGRAELRDRPYAPAPCQICIAHTTLVIRLKQKSSSPWRGLLSSKRRASRYTLTVKYSLWQRAIDSLVFPVCGHSRAAIPH